MGEPVTLVTAVTRASEPSSPNTANAALRRLGYAEDEGIEGRADLARPDAVAGRVPRLIRLLVICWWWPFWIEASAFRVGVFATVVSAINWPVLQDNVALIPVITDVERRGSH